MVTTEVGADGVAVLALSRPDRLNALSTAVAADLHRAVDDVATNPAVRAIVVAGEGKAFCAGADIAEFAELDGPAQFGDFIGRLTESLNALAECPKPSVAALHGLAFGGGLELALACDIRIADESARLGVPEIKLGLLPGAAGTARLPRMLPVPVARHMLLTGEPLTAGDAHRYGLVAKVVPAGQARPEARAQAADLAALPPLALAAAKRLLAANHSIPESAAIELERQTVPMLFATADREEGVRAFLEKRAPRFAGR